MLTKIKKNCKYMILVTFMVKNVFGNDGLHNIFIYKPTFNTLELKEDKCLEYIKTRKSKELFKYKLDPLYNAFLLNTLL